MHTAANLMWISSFVVTLADDRELRTAVIEALRAIPCLTVGESPTPGRVPVVVEADDSQQSRYWFEWVEQLPGVVKVDVAFVSCDEGDRKATPLVNEAVAEATR